MKTRVENDTVVIDELTIPRALYDALVWAGEDIGIEKAMVWALEDWPRIDNQQHADVRETFLSAAMTKYKHNDQIEIDPDAARIAYSGVRGGAYVQGWLWVDDEEAGVAPGERPDES